MQFLSVVIPVYNAELTLRALHKELMPALEAITPQFEVIFVEDRGRDRSWEVISELAGGDERIRGLRLSRNYGQHNALLCGIRAARGDVIVTMDDDLQNPPSEISQLVEKLDEGFDVVYGRPAAEQHGLFRDLASRMTKLALQNAMGVESASSVSAFRAFRGSLRNAFADFRGPSVSIDVLLTWGTSQFGVVKVKHLPRAAGESNYNVFKLVTHAFNLLTGFSTLPLQLASYMGFAATLFGLAILAYVLGGWLINGAAVQGFTFLASIVAIFGGAQLFAIGIFGEYLARMHFRSMERPAYIVAQATAAQDKSNLSAPATEPVSAPEHA